MLPPVEQALEDWLIRARLAHDGRIPAERVLAAELGVSRAELRKALARLEEEGQLLRQVGRGSFLRDRPGPSEDMTAAPREQAEEPASSTSPRDLMRARLALEPILAALAAEDASALQIDLLLALSRPSGPLPAKSELPPGESGDTGRPDIQSASDRPAAPDPTALSDGETDDIRFHTALAGATRNPVLISAYDRLTDIRRGIGWGRLRDRVAAATPASLMRAEHRAIATAIADRDRHTAEAAMRHHLLVEANTMFGSGL